MTDLELTVKAIHPIPDDEPAPTATVVLTGATCPQLSAVGDGRLTIEVRCAYDDNIQTLQKSARIHAGRILRSLADDLPQE